MKTKNQMQPALKRFFEEYLPVVKGASDNTMRSYRYSFRLLLQSSNGWKKKETAAYPPGTSGSRQSGLFPIMHPAIISNPL